jgi:peptidoglycan/xylan/chitin deacetylase (PgdA/CDA1 family)
LVFLILCLLAQWTLQPATAAAASPGSDATCLYGELQQNRLEPMPEGAEVPRRPTVYLTFDDGPSKLTPEVLDILQEEKVPATFFVLGKYAEEYPDTIRRMLGEGHAVGNHTYDHVYKELYMDYQTFWDQVQRTDRILYGITGRHPALLRAPGGTYTNFDAFYFYYLQRAGYTVWDWNIDSGDSARADVPAEEIYRTVGKGPFRQQTVVLMHDGIGHEETVKALPGIIRLFKDKGYSFAALSPEEKPVRFRLTKPKWERTETPEQFARHAAEAVAFRAVLAADPEPAGGEQTEPAPSAVPAAAEAAETLLHEKKIPLRLKWQSGEEVIPGERYFLQDGTIRISLRTLVEALGGSILWDQQRRTAAVRYGWVTAEYDLPRMEVRLEVPGQPDRTYHLPDMKLIDGTLFVPLRLTLDSFGDRVTGYRETDGIREADFSVHEGVSLALFRAPAPRK